MLLSLQHLVSMSNRRGLDEAYNKHVQVIEQHIGKDGKGNPRVRCLCCPHAHQPFIAGATKLRAHLLGTRGVGIRVCRHVPNYVKAVMQQLRPSTVETSRMSIRKLQASFMKMAFRSMQQGRYHTKRCSKL